MKVLLVGGGGREHAIAWKLRESPLVDVLLCAPGNAGIAEFALVFPDIRATDLNAIVALAIREAVDFVVVAPDDPLALGLVDRLEAAHIPAFGPMASAARIEASKIYSKALMKKYGIPTAGYEAFDTLKDAEVYIKKMGTPTVIKCDGLALGKGVIVAHTEEEALEAVRMMMSGERFGSSGKRVVIEEYLSGPEVTQMVFVDGMHASLMPSSQDHKRACDCDCGPNTGGMGAITPSPYLTRELQARIAHEIIAPSVQMMIDEGAPFKGVLYVGLMLTADGPKVIEYNARFGDPEAQAVLPLLESDLMEIFIACREGTLNRLAIHWSDRCCATVVLASGGYPARYVTGYPITGLDHATEGGAFLFHAGTKPGSGALKGTVMTDGGRVLAVSALGDTRSEAVEQAYFAVSRINFPDMHLRTDIGRVSP